MRFSKKFAALSIVAAGALVAGGAFAYWTSGGGGTGSGSTANPDLTDVITVNQTAVAGDALYPGGPVQTMSGNFTNSYAGSVRVASVSAALGDLSGTGCVAADFTIGGSPAAVNQDIATGTANGTWGGITLAMNNTSVSQDGCKGESVPLVYTAN